MNISRNRDNSKSLLAGLNDQQKEAVKHLEGPLLVLSGAGSGKTLVITRRIAYMIEKHGIPSSQILGLTFTNKAAGEMKTRLEDLLSERDKASPPWLGTFHSLGVEFLREFIDLLGTEHSRYFTIFDQKDQKKLVKEVCKERDISTEEFRPGMIWNFINEAKNSLIGPDQFYNYKSGEIDDYLLEVLHGIYNSYQQKLSECNALDFGDLIRLPVKLLGEREEETAWWRDRFKFILVDEYQDTNKGQYEFSRHLIGQRKNICVVGDDDQAIFSWRGANVENILDFEEDYPGAKVIHLSKNYRSKQSILDAANSLISNNNYRKKKEMEPSRGKGGVVSIYPAEDEKEEARFVASKIQEIRGKGVNLDEIGVLFRVNTLSRQLEDSLIYSGIPYQIVKGTRFYERQEVKDILAYVRILCNYSDDISLIRIINRPRRGIGGKTMEAIRDYSSKKGISIWDALTDIENGDGDDSLEFSSRQKNAIGSFLDLMRSLESKMGEVEPSRLIDFIIESTDYFSYLEKKFDERSVQDRKDNLKELKGQIEAVSGEKDLEDFLEMVTLEADVGRLNDREDGVSLLTLHSAKGLEFKYVFMVGFEDGLLPHRRSIDEGRIEEERRLCYVGMTRAKEGLFICYARRRYLYGQTFNNSPSRFLKELPDLEKEKSGSKKVDGRTGSTESFGSKGPSLGWKDYIRG